MRAGTLHERIAIQALTPSMDAQWGAVDQWVDVDEVWASVIARTETEALKDKGVDAQIIHDIAIRYRDDVTSANRVVWKGNVLDILSAVDPDGRRRQLKIEAVERQGQLVVQESDNG